MRVKASDMWEVLQNITNFACCYVYANRDGKIVFEQDEFGVAVERGGIANLVSRSFKKKKITISFRDKDRAKAEASIRLNGLREYDYDATLFCTDKTQEVPKVIEYMAYNI